MHFIRNEEKEKWIEDYVERETVGARQPVGDAEAAIRQEQEDTERAENMRLMTIMPKKMFHEMMIAIGDSLSDIALSNNGGIGEDENNEETVEGKLSEDDEPGWVAGTVSKTIQQCIKRFR